MAEVRSPVRDSTLPLDMLHARIIMNFSLTRPRRQITLNDRGGVRHASEGGSFSWHFRSSLSRARRHEAGRRATKARLSSSGWSARCWRGRAPGVTAPRRPAAACGSTRARLYSKAATAARRSYLATPQGSLLIQAIRHEDGLAMPPKQPRLSEETIAAFVTWVELGAPTRGPARLRQLGSAWPEEATSALGVPAGPEGHPAVCYASRMDAEPGRCLHSGEAGGSTLAARAARWSG